MVSVTQFAQYLLKLDPQKNVARLALYHYLKNLCDINAEFRIDTIREFYLRILNFQYWQGHQQALGEVIAQDLDGFIKEHRLKWDLTEFRHAHQMQLIELKFQKDFTALVQTACDQQKKLGDRVKLLQLSEAQMLAIILFSTGSLKVQIYNNMAVLDGGRLKSLLPLTNLEYDSKMDLLPLHEHWVEGPMLTLNRFQLTDEGVRGWILRGYTLQKYETFNGGSLPQQPELFYTLKRVEKHYINPQSDPFYQELVGMLEKAYQMLSHGHHDAHRMGEAALQRGKQALKNIFPNDKLLLLLVTNVEHYLISKKDNRSAEWQNLKPLN